MTVFVLVRHGETEWNRQRRVQGHIDIPLNGAGQEQARRLGIRVGAEHAREPIAALLTSDLARAEQTAAAISSATGVASQRDARFRERSFGVLEGLELHEMESRHPEVFRRWRAREPDYVLPAGESLRQFIDRVEAGLRDWALRVPRGRLMVATHGGVLDVVYRLATGLSWQAHREHQLLNASLNTVALDGGTFRLVDWGDDAHLQDVRAGD